MAPKLKRYPRIWYVSLLVPPFRAMTVPPFGIFIRKQFRGDEQILRHDLVHWQQYERMGLVLYYFRYFTQLLFIGYDTMPMEIEARKRSGDDEDTIWNYRDHYHKK
jgi:hypothetical protein